jgi:hypothetical protein
VVVQEAPLSPDKYEKDDNITQAYLLGANFSNNISYVNTDGSNCHIGSDVDFYKIVLPSGYDYTIKANLDDSRYSPNGKTYTLDAVVSYSLDGTNWSDAYDDVLPDAIMKGGGTIYFKVAPYFSGQTGTYLLELNLQRTVSSGISIDQLESELKIYPNPAKSLLNIEISDLSNEIKMIRLTDMQGRELFEESISDRNQTHQIPVSSLPEGIYSLCLQTANGFINRKITIAR